MAEKSDTPCYHRRSMRMKGYDYSQPGAYFITVVTWKRMCIFGRVLDGEMQLNDLEKIVIEEWKRTPLVRSDVSIGAFVVMPNHLHGVLIMEDFAGGTMRTSDGMEPLVGAMCRIAPTAKPHGAAAGSVGAIIGQIKSITTKRINRLRGSPGSPVWQRNYYDHIIRDDEEHEQIHLYIDANPANWEEDEENPERGC